jgi:hypothetical protein
MSQFLGTLDARMPQYQSSILDDVWAIRAGRVDFSHRRRGESEFGARNRFWTLWTKPMQMSGDLSDGYSQIGQDSSSSGRWSPWQKALRGNGSVKFIMGQCKDESGASISGATVQGFVTASDLYVGETTSNSQGYYQLGTPYPATNHYLVAYKAGSPDVSGTTVNTLQPTNVDGS